MLAWLAHQRNCVRMLVDTTQRPAYRPERNPVSTPQKDFFNTIGTKRTYRMSAISCFRGPSGHQPAIAEQTQFMSTRLSLTDDEGLPLICPTCQVLLQASMPAMSGYFAWGCFQYFWLEGCLCRTPWRPRAAPINPTAASSADVP